MNATKLDPRGRTLMQTSKTIRRFLSRTGLLPSGPARAADRHDPRGPSERIPVWDARLGAFRRVDPRDPHDPPRESARLLASLRTTLSDQASPLASAPKAEPTGCPAPALAGQRDDPPRSPFGGSNVLALEQEWG